MLPLRILRGVGERAAHEGGSARARAGALRTLRLPSRAGSAATLGSRPAAEKGRGGLMGRPSQSGAYFAAPQNGLKADDEALTQPPRNRKYAGRSRYETDFEKYEKIFRSWPW